jgi:hypothetical protein
MKQHKINSATFFYERSMLAQTLYEDCIELRSDPVRLKQIQEKMYHEQPLMCLLEHRFHQKLKSFSNEQFEELNTLLILIWCFYRETNKIVPPIAAEIFDELLAKDKRELDESRKLDKEMTSKKREEFFNTNPSVPLYSFLLKKVFTDFHSVFQFADNIEKHKLLVGLEVLVDCFEDVTAIFENRQKESPIDRFLSFFSRDNKRSKEFA